MRAYATPSGDFVPGIFFFFPPSLSFFLLFLLAASLFSFFLLSFPRSVNILKRGRVGWLGCAMLTLPFPALCFSLFLPLSLSLSPSLLPHFFLVAYSLFLFLLCFLIVSLGSSPAALSLRASLKFPPLRGHLERTFALFAPPSRYIPIQTASREACPSSTRTVRFLWTISGPSPEERPWENSSG